MKNSRVRLNSLIAFTVALLAIILIATWVATQKINEVAEERCFDSLYDEAHSMSTEIRQNVIANRQQLELIASVAADYDDFTDEALLNKLKDYTVSGLLSRIEILLPGDIVVTQDGRRINVGGKLSFAEEAAKGEHITGRVEDVTGSGETAIRHFVPIVRDGETVAMLYGVGILKDMPSKLVDKPYNGEAAVYIIDGDTGDFLMDTWHDELGNLWAFGSRQMADGYDNSSLKQGVVSGESNYVVFVSKTIGEYLYFYYTPIVGINNWRVALSVPESLVFAQAQRISDTLDGFLFAEVLCFVVYLCGILLYVRFEAKENARRMELLNRIYEVERLLFNAHEDSDRVSMALERVADMTQAGQVSYLMLTNPGYDISFTWIVPGSGLRQNDFAVQCRNGHDLMQYFEQSGNEYYRASGTAVQEYIHDARERGINNILAVPIEDAQMGISGVLVAFNLNDANSDPTLLKSLGVSFSMFCHNMRTHYSVKELGERDLLTGLYNRNRYELDIEDCRSMYKKTLACVYADANSLHELNNRHGHAAGDKMLQAVANALTRNFGSAYAYRIGGDEFLAFAADMPLEEAEKLAAQCEAEVKKAGYEAAFGYAVAEDVEDASALVKAAEQKMYESKRSYYASHGKRSARA